MLGRRIVSTAYFALITRTGTTTIHAFPSLSSSSSTSTLSALVHTSSSSSSSFRMDTNNYSLFGRRTKNIGSSVSVSARIRSSSLFSGSSSSSLGASSESDCTNNLETTTTTSSTTTTMSSSSSSSELPEYDESIETTTTTSSTPIFDTTLVSIQQCITAYNQQQQQQQKQGGAPSSKIVFIDGSWYHKPNPITNKFRNPTREFQIGPRLPSARYVNIDELATTSTLFPNNDNANDNDNNANNNPRKNPTTTTGAGGLQLQLQLPHMMPPPHLFGLSMDAYNIRKEDTVVVYGRRGALFTPRVWFLFVCMGHEEGKVHLLQGSLEDYVEEGGVVELDSLLADTTTMDGDHGDDVDDDGDGYGDDNRQNDGNDDRYDYYASMGEGYIDCFDEGVLNVTRLYHRHYSTTIPEYKMDVISAMNICGKEEVLDAVNQYLDDAAAAADDDDDDGDSTTTTTTAVGATKETTNEKDDTNSTSNNTSNSNSSTSRRFEKTIILDTRGSGYAKNGHMPSAIHLPYTSIATPTNSLKIRSKFELEKLFEERVAGVDVLDPELKIILSCGSGVSVCHGYLALKELGRNITEENTRIYDGSWKEWGKDEDLPKIFPGEE